MSFERYSESIENNQILRRSGLAIGVTAVSAALLVSCGSTKDTATIADVGSTIEFAAQDIDMVVQEKASAAARCERQTKLDPRAYNSCQYVGAYAAISKKYPKWVEKHDLAIPGNEERADRRKLFFKTHPAIRKLVVLENQAGINYRSPNSEMWNNVNDNECSDTWDCNTGNGYYGGLQMDMSFQSTYNQPALKLWGVASNWPMNAQMLAADRAYNGYNGYSARGLGPWPSSNAEFGTFPVPVRKTS